METSSKSKRTPSRCREWERNRRNKFNDAISKLGEIVKKIRNIDCPDENSDDDNVKYPKIEIIQKAIICLTNYAQEETQLKAEILALQVKLESEKIKKGDQKDASTQVYFGLAKKNKGKDGKYVKMVMIKTSKNKKVKEKAKNVKPTPSPLTGTSKKLPILLPRSNLGDKKGPENTIVVLPASPFIFPQRSLIFPSLPPAIVLVDPNLQTLNKTPLCVVNRNNNDITRTTMVNILPISAYSRPLSATKNKIFKRPAKKFKGSINVSKDSQNPKDLKEKQEVNTKDSKKNETDKNNDSSNTENNKEVPICDIEVTDDKVPAKSSSKEKIPVTTKCDSVDNNVSDIHSLKQKEVPNIEKAKCTESVVKEISNPRVSLPITVKPLNNIKSKVENTKFNKTLDCKETTTENKEKENKLPNILETPPCDNVVDVGNARLELAEEFLATSPTAAFLMSFPLVSGNRADSPAEEAQNIIQSNTKYSQSRNELPSIPFYQKPNTSDTKIKAANKQNEHVHKQHKYVPNIVTKESTTLTTTISAVTKTSSTVTVPNISQENPFLNLSMPSIITNCSLPETAFNLDFDCSISKTVPSHTASYANSNNFFYKSDPFGSVKNTIYSTSSISSSHEFNALGLYPCAMEKYASKNKTEYGAVDENLMKMGSSRLTYDIDLGWSHKGFDFVNCTSGTNTLSKDSILATTSTPYTSSYNPFNPDFHIPLVSSTNKKDTTNKTSTSYPDTITSFYSQPANFWSEDVPFYTNSNISKNMNSKNQSYPLIDHVHSNIKLHNNNKHYETKVAESAVENAIKPTNNVSTQQITEKYTKKSPSKMHINWMTSEIRPMQNSSNPITHTVVKDSHKPVYNQLDHAPKKQDQNESNYFPIPMHNFPAQPAQEEFQMWPSARPLGTTEISIEPPPINLPTLVGDLALGPHDKKKTGDVANRLLPQADIQNCGNFLSVTQLMNRSSENMASRYHVLNADAQKQPSVKQSNTNFSNDTNRKSMTGHVENNVPQSCYVFNNPKISNPYDSMNQFSHTKVKTNNKTEKPSKSQKTNYSTEALLRGANCTQKVQDNTKFMMPTQKYSDYNLSQDSSVAQVSHFPPILDYSENNYTGQQFSGTNLYNTTTNTISNSFYSNFMPGSSNIMSSNYPSTPFTGEFIDYNQDCNYSSHKYEELKMRNNTSFQAEKVPSNYKSSRRESAAKHKLECSKKESTKKYQSKKAKMNNDVEEWNDPSHLLWQNKASSKKHTSLTSEELPFPNYVGNQMASQYQTDFYNSHLMPTNVQTMGHNVDRSLSSFPVTSRANFNLSTIFPEITMKVQ